jgi:hypothetical protein
MKTDAYGCIINDPLTYSGIAVALNEHGAVLIPWTDEMGTQYDILFTRPGTRWFVISPSIVQGGIRNSDLFISIMRVGSFGFQMGGESHVSYYEEKLHLPPGDRTNLKLAELFNGVRMYGLPA